MEWIELLAMAGFIHLVIGGILLLVAMVAVIIAMIEYFKE